MKTQTKFQQIKSTLLYLIEMYGGFKALTPFIIAQIQEDLQSYFRNISDGQLAYTRNYMNSLKSKNK